MKRLKNTERNVKNKAYTTMNKLIEEAERLYKQIDELQGKLAFNLSNDDNETLIKAKCFISNILDRKDNIVDLSEVWHNTDEESKEGWIILQNKYDETDFIIMELECTLQESWFNTNTIGRWAYLFDLLPKGGDNDKGRID